MAKTVAINGFGRIGRLCFREICSNFKNLEIVAINDTREPKILSYLLKYDSIYGMYSKSVRIKDGNLWVEGKEVKLFSEKNPLKLPWKDLKVDIVLECSDSPNLNFLKNHLKAGAKKVIVCGDHLINFNIPLFILGVNEENYEKKYDIVSIGSCNLNCLAPILKVLSQNFELKNCFFNVIHSLSQEQIILGKENGDIRKSRIEDLSIVPILINREVKLVQQLIPSLKDKIEGMMVRVPVSTVSSLDLICEIDGKSSREELNYIFKKASQEKRLIGILGIEDAPLISSDYIGNSFSAIIDANLTRVMGNLVRIFAWYDNELSVARRLAEFANFVSEML